MRDWKIWIIAFVVEVVLLAIGLYLAGTNASLGDGILIALTQLPGSYLSEILLWETATNIWAYMFTAIFQTLFFGTVLHAAKFVKNKVINPSPARPDPPK